MQEGLIHPKKTEAMIAPGLEVKSLIVPARIELASKGPMEKGSQALKA